MKKNISVLVLLLVTLTLAAQNREVTGKVTSAEDGSVLPGVMVTLKGTATLTTTDHNGVYSISVPQNGVLVFSFIGWTTKEIPLSVSNIINVSMNVDQASLEEVIVTGTLSGRVAGIQVTKSEKGIRKSKQKEVYISNDSQNFPEYNTEEYDGIVENNFRDASRTPLSTFSIDVDAASYSNVRRFLNDGQRPPVDAVRIEEMINYFDYDYEDPKDEHPFSIYTEVSTAPWAPTHQLVHIGLQGKRIPTKNLPSSNLVFLIDVSGSMSDDNKLPLLKSSMKMLVEQLRERDHVAMVVYAGAAGLVLSSTPGSDKEKFSRLLITWKLVVLQPVVLV